MQKKQKNSIHLFCGWYASMGLRIKNKTILSTKNSLFGNILLFGSNYIQHYLG